MHQRQPTESELEGNGLIITTCKQDKNFHRLQLLQKHCKNIFKEVKVKTDLTKKTMAEVKKYKRPSSARRHIKQEQFTSFVSLSRLQRVQDLLSSDGSSSPDGLLCISGIDSRYNEGMLGLINYLLFDFFAVRRKEIERSGFEEDIVEDIMFLIRKNSVDVYCNPINYMYFLPYVAHWRNLHIHCMTDEDYEDEEKAEEFKITSFIAMTKSSSKIAVPFSGANQEHEFDIMKIEKWPIVQAFALEGMGGGGFFTMKYEVGDVSNALLDIYQLLDPVALESLVTDHLPLFERQWESLVSNVEILHGESIKKLTGSYLIEPLKSYFTHGRIGSAKGGKRAKSERQPFVLVGMDSDKSMLEQGDITGVSTKDSVVIMGCDKTPAIHMVCQAVSPKSPICCRRTYFFSNGVLPYPVFNKNSSGESLPAKNDCRLMILVYMACIESLLASIDVYAETLDPLQAKICCMQTLLECWERLHIPFSSSHIAAKENIDFKLEAFDNLNRNVPLTDDRVRLLAKTTSVTVYNIPSIEHRGQSIGSVSFGETFLNSVLNMDNGEIDGAVTVLSSSVPRMITWQTSSKEQVANDRIYRELAQIDSNSQIMGDKIINGEPVKYITESSRDFIITDGLLHLYENGLVYIHPQNGIIVLPKAEMTAIHLYDGDSPSVVAFLIISYQEHIQEYLPVHLQCQFNRFILAFEPKTKSYKKLFTEVLPVWKEEDARPELQRIEEELPEELKPKHAQLQESFKLATGPPSKNTPMVKAKERIDGLGSFLTHFEGSSVSPNVIPRKHAALIAGREWDEGSFGGSVDELIVTVISGLPGSGKAQLCQVISKLAQSESRWTIIKPPVDGLHTFDKEELQNHLRSTYLAYRHKRGEQPPKSKMRALIVTPGFIDTKDVIQAVVDHPDKELAKKIKVGAVTVCIDPHNAYMCDRYPLPKLLDQCAQGWVNNIVFTCAANPEDEVLAHLQNTVRATNSNVSFFLAENAELTRSSDIDLILSDSAFNKEEHVRARYLSSPGWWNGKFNSGELCPKMCEVMFRFSQPLEKSRLTTRLKGLKLSLTRHPFHGNVYHIRGKLTLTDSPKQVYEMEYLTLAEALTLTPVGKATSAANGPTPYSVIFTGVELNEEKLKEWLTGCAKPKPEKKVQRKRSSLNRVEVNRVHKENHLAPLPEGWFYNGAQYVSLAGDKSSFHPDLELFLEKYLQQVNIDVDVYNEEIDRQQYADLFD